MVKRSRSRSRKVSRKEHFGSYGAHNNKHGGRRSRRRENFGAHNKHKEHFSSCGSHTNKTGGKRSRRRENFGCSPNHVGGRKRKSRKRSNRRK